MKNKFLLTVLAILTGCTMVPKTRISFSPSTHELNIQSQKDVDMEGVEATVETNGAVHVKIQTYKSANNASVITAVANGNAQMLKQASDVLSQITAAGVQAAK